MHPWVINPLARKMIVQFLEGFPFNDHFNLLIFDFILSLETIAHPRAEYGWNMDASLVESPLALKGVEALLHLMKTVRIVVEIPVVFAPFEGGLETSMHA